MGNTNFEQLPKKHYESLAEFESTYWWHVSRVNWVESLIKSFDKKAFNVLDYGCGTGGFLSHLRKKFNFKSSLGVDASVNAIAAAKTHGDGYVLVDQDSYKFSKNTDIIFLMDVLEHIEHDKEFIEKILKRLKNQGRIILSVPALPLLFSEWDVTLGHHRRYTKNSLKKIMRGLDCEIEFISYGFSYIAPLVYIKRKFFSSASDKNCEFLKVPKWLNTLLICLNKIEIMISQIFPIAFGSSLFCMVRKRIKE